MLLAIPWYIRELAIGTQWNWTGKLIAIAGSLIFYRIFRSEFKEHDFFTLKQKPGSVKPNIILTLVISLIVVAMGIFLYGTNEPDLETFFFQLGMPSLDEEFAFRGIMLGLLCTALKSNLKIGTINLGNPSIIVTAILFGLVHSLNINSHWEVSQDWLYFSYTFAYGLALAWMTLKSKSVLFPIISHILSNEIGTMITWIK
jgi:membrane protease YdiL (CAAX protease family)